MGWVIDRIDKQIKKTKERRLQIESDLKTEYKTEKFTATYSEYEAGKGFLIMDCDKFMDSRKIVIKIDIEAAAEIIEFIEHSQKE